VRRPLGRAKPGGVGRAGGGGGVRVPPLVLVLVMLARRWLRPRWLESIGPGFPYIAKHMFKCSRCFIGMLQVFYMNVTKVDLVIAYVATVVHVCYKLRFPMFYL
jgi:hypothetical protein